MAISEYLSDGPSGYSEKHHSVGLPLMVFLGVAAYVAVLAITANALFPNKHRTEPVYEMSAPVIKDVRGGPEPETFYEVNGQKYFLKIDGKFVEPPYPDNHPQ